MSNSSRSSPRTLVCRNCFLICAIKLLSYLFNYFVSLRASSPLPCSLALGWPVQWQRLNAAAKIGPRRRWRRTVRGSLTNKPSATTDNTPLYSQSFVRDLVCCSWHRDGLTGQSLLDVLCEQSVTEQLTDNGCDVKTVSFVSGVRNYQWAREACDSARGRRGSTRPLTPWPWT